MNQMGHDVPNLIGARTEGLDEKVRNLLPGLLHAAGTLLGAEAVFPLRHEALPADAVVQVEPQVGVVGEEVQGTGRARWS